MVGEMAANVCQQPIQSKKDNAGTEVVASIVLKLISPTVGNDSALQIVIPLAESAVSDATVAMGVVPDGHDVASGLMVVILRLSELSSLPLREGTAYMVRE
jgi:hypothetical protein